MTVIHHRPSDPTRGERAGATVWAASCSCGWISNDYPRRSDADDAVWDHARAAGYEETIEDECE